MLLRRSRVRSFYPKGRIVIWENENVLKIPSSALFRSGEAWSVFVVEGGKAFRRQVELGQRTPCDAEILNGLEEDAQVIVHPSNEITEAMSVATQKQLRSQRREFSR